jgi:hypothetical protein
MTTAASPFLRDVIARGQFHQCTDLEALDKAAQAGVTGYIGFDMTAPSLHIGNLTQIMYLRRLQRAGGKPIVLLGGGTTRVGDPSGKEEMRQLLSEEQIAKNTASIRSTFEKFLSFGDAKSDAILVDNAEWLMPLNYLDFLRTVGRHMSVNRGHRLNKAWTQSAFPGSSPNHRMSRAMLQPACDRKASLPLRLLGTLESAYLVAPRTVDQPRFVRLDRTAPSAAPCPDIARARRSPGKHRHRK